MYGAASIGLNTLIVAIMKCIFIVYALKAMLFESRIQDAFVSFHIVFPLAFAILLMLSYELTDLDENITKFFSLTFLHSKVFFIYLISNP